MTRMTPPNVARNLTLGPQCWGCRERRVRCGSETPGCLKCAVKGVDCPGYGHTRPLRWRKPQSPRKFSKNLTGEVSLTKVCPVVLSPKSLQLEHEILYFNGRVAPDLVVMDSSSNPFRHPLKLSAQIPAYFNYIYASISTCHRIIQRYYGNMHMYRAQSTGMAVSTKSTPSLTDPDEAALYHYHASALKGLNEALSKATRGPPNIDILGGVMLILHSQLQQAAYGQWRIHLDGFKKLIEFYGGCEDLLKDDRPASIILANVLIIDVMSNTTTPVYFMTQDTLRWHSAYLGILPRMDHDLVLTPTPIPLHVLKAVTMVNIVRARSHQTRSELGRYPNFTFSEVLAELGIWLETENTVEGLGGSSANYDGTNVQTPDHLLFADSYQSAVIIYATETYMLISENSLHEVAYTIRYSAYNSLMTALRVLFELKDNTQSGEAYWKFIFWPLAIAGVQSVVARHHRGDFEYICTKLYEMTAALGSHCMRDAAIFLERLWMETSDSGADGHPLTWDEIFKDAPLFLL